MIDPLIVLLILQVVTKGLLNCNIDGRNNDKAKGIVDKWFKKYLPTIEIKIKLGHYVIRSPYYELISIFHIKEILTFLYQFLDWPGVAYRSRKWKWMKISRNQCDLKWLTQTISWVLGVRIVNKYVLFWNITGNMKIVKFVKLFKVLCA